MAERQKCIITLSTRSAGSSALYKYLESLPNINSVDFGRNRNIQTKNRETFYWVNAAALRGHHKPQRGTKAGGYISYALAKEHMQNLLIDNLGSGYTVPTNDEELIFEGWRSLCNNFGPVFVEKSPGHLYRWSAIEMILECIKKLPDIEFRLIGLYRNPVASNYSQWTRWNLDPYLLDREWFVAQSNLLRLKQLVSDQLILVRYEDMAKDSNSALEEIFNFAGVAAPESGFFHINSLAKWNNDKSFDFYKISKKTEHLAITEFDYVSAELVNKNFKAFSYTRYLIKRSLEKGRTLILTLIKMVVKKESRVQSK